ncbi:MAG: VCBS repeat-containing protein, partial [Candidatus Thorarchaeota archaeon]
MSFIDARRRISEWFAQRSPGEIGYNKFTGMMFMKASQNRVDNKSTVCMYSKGTVTVVKMSLFLLVMTLIVLPISCSYSEQESVTLHVTNPSEQFMPASNLIRLDLPYDVKFMAAGNTSLGRGVVWVHEGLIRFKDPVGLIDSSIPISDGTVFHETLVAADIDDDGSSEFLFMLDNKTTMILVVADFDTTTSTEYLFPVSNPLGVIIGDFNGDGDMDAGVFGPGRLITMDLSDGSPIGFFSPPSGEVVDASPGNFSLEIGDEIAIMFLTGNIVSAPVTNIHTMYGNGTSIDQIQSAVGVRGFDIECFGFGTDFDNVAVTMLDHSKAENVLEGLNGNLTQRFEVRDQKVLSDSYVKVGHFTDDQQEDLVVARGIHASVCFVDGFDGKVLWYTDDYSVARGSRGFSTAMLDSDMYTDVAIEGPRGQIALIRGSNGLIGYEDPRILSPFEQVLTFDINGDDREDIVALSDQVNILLSDKDPPSVSLDPIYPSHPTFYDPYLKVELTATDEMYIERATLYIRPAATTVPLFQANEMTEAPNGKYIFIETALQPGDYLYYIEVSDPYLNSYFYGNETYPRTLTVEGHFFSGASLNATFDHAMHHVMDVGNDSAGTSQIYMVAVDAIKRTAALKTFAPNGTLLSEFILTDTSTGEVFEVYVGNLDGDSVVDPVLTSYNGSMTRVFAFHGINITSWQNASYPIQPVMTEHAMIVTDDDSDGIDEMVYVGVNDTVFYLIRADNAFSSWSNTTLSGSPRIVDYAVANLYGVDPQIGILRDNGSLNLYESNNLTMIKTLNYASPGATPNDMPREIHRFRNMSHGSDQLVVVYTG